MEDPVPLSLSVRRNTASGTDEKIIEKEHSSPLFGNIGEMKSFDIDEYALILLIKLPYRDDTPYKADISRIILHLQLQE